MFCAPAISSRYQYPPPQSQSCPAAPASPAKYHFTCRKGFINQKSLEVLRRQVENCGEAGQNQPQLRRIASDTRGSSANPAVLPDTCVFCKKTKYKPETRTRESLRSAEEYKCVFCKKTKYKPKQEQGSHCVAPKNSEQIRR